jgi:hypothetical protein
MGKSPLLGHLASPQCGADPILLQEAFRKLLPILLKTTDRR